MVDTPAKPHDGRTPRRFPKGHHPARRARSHARLLRHPLALPPHRRRLTEHPQFRVGWHATPGDARRSSTPGRSRAGARLARVSRRPWGHAGGHSCTSGSQPPLPLALPLPPFSPPCLARPVGIATVRSRTPEPHSPLRGGELGRERPPSDRPIYGPETRIQASPSARSRRSLPARADGATDPCGKAISG